ncbi:MAG: D-tyrosyl-tRNA(Tyr) deacylase [Spirochaetae bacterium HGW-Spirochaetae-8]|jgi:D-tyrosyl-tRNA(Tyr) deacylase|nr:MAG: D-tyrosyl-tRNA(Tyr) deacylase [Spirochaetae bacterium HGW-Spirochaetae-8]
MRSVLQRVSHAQVTVNDQLIGRIGMGLLVYLGVRRGDSYEDLNYLANKIPKMRLFEDENQKMNLSLLEVQGEILVVSQFTLCADLTKGNRPSFDPAAEPAFAQEMYERFVNELRSKGIVVATGEFGGKMLVSYTNMGPVTIILDSPPKKEAIALI